MNQRLNSLTRSALPTLFAVSALVACAETSTSLSAVTAIPSAGSLSLQPGDWDTISNPEKLPLGNDAS